VLVVEDEDPLRRLLERLLVREGYHVTLARHGADALHIASALEHPIELVITDLVMPELGGREVAEALRANNPALPFCSSRGTTRTPWSSARAITHPRRFSPSRSREAHCSSACASSRRLATPRASASRRPSRRGIFRR
jgi:DNA-binding NarL/FixJ family response regulator